MKRFILIFALVAIVAVPFLLRPKRVAAGRDPAFAEVVAHDSPFRARLVR